MKNPITFDAWRRDPIMPPGFWFRIFGYGLHVMLSSGYRPMFSERAGHVRPLYFCGLRVLALQP